MQRTGSPESEAWHEAGHGVVAHQLGARVLVLTLEADEDGFDGRVSVQWPPATEHVRAEQSALAALGGPLAELLHRGEEDLDDPQLVQAWDGDWQEVERCAAVCEPDPDLRTDLIRGWIRSVQRTLGDGHVEELVARVADALDAHGTLDEALFLDAVGG